LLRVAPALEVRAVVAPDGDPLSGGDWVDCTDLQSPDRIERALARIREAQGWRPEAAASSYLGWYTAHVAGPAVAAFTVAHRVPDLAREKMSLHTGDGGYFDATAFHGDGMTVLAHDPVLIMSDETWARTVADGHALRARLVGEVVGHLEPMVATMRSLVRLGLPALWGTVATQCARAFLLTERITGHPHLGRVEADAFFAVASPPLRARPTWHEFVHRGRHHTGMRRGSCCLLHKTTSQYCTTCPFISDTEREHRLRTWIDTQGRGGLAV
jgi:ferric iron reductase protein FhuF